jgi:predicted nucleotidyltransferase component of viral defense system
MIDRRGILEAASSFSLLPGVVEKGYVLGWMLAGIYAHEDLTESWIFKGGTCLKKCHFETFRFSGDLDYTLRNEEHLDEDLLELFDGENHWYSSCLRFEGLKSSIPVVFRIKRAIQVVLIKRNAS